MARIRLCAALAVALIVLAAPVPGAGASEGKVVIAQGVDPSTLDAMNQQETPASVVAAHLYDTLVERDQNLKLVPGLAAEMPKLLAPTVWEIKLRKGVKFHNGEEFNADSVKYSLERVKDPSMRGSSNFKPIDRVEVVDPYTVKDSPFISKNPIGTGPYRLVRWTKDEELLLEAWPQYWRGPAKIKNVVFRPIPDDAVRVAALQNGEIEVGGE